MRANELREDGIPLLETGINYALHIPMPSIGSAGCNIDIASDYAWALFTIEELRPHTRRLLSRGLSDTFPYSLKIVFSPEDIMKCQEALVNISLLFDEDQPEEAEGTRISAIEFEDKLAEAPTIALPDLGDSFLANYVTGIAQIWADDALEEHYRKFPTWRYGYWKSFLGQKLGMGVYASSQGWIVPRELKITRLLQILGWSSAESQVSLQPTQLLKSGALPWILVNDLQCLVVPVDALNTAAACWQYAIRVNPASALAPSFEFGDIPTGDYLSVHNDTEWLVSSDGSIVIVRFHDVQLLTFLESSARLRPEQIAKYLDAAKHTYGALAKHSLVDNALDWTQTDPGEFEEICYQVLLKCERFDPNRMRKIGNVRSRDGGRDIEVWTHERAGVPAQKWIYQCKFSSNPKLSLSGLKTSVADVVDQFDADGYGVMTNMLIDATLYDKLDGICQTRKRSGRALHVDTWSRLELERFLNAQIELLARYFRR